MGERSSRLDIMRSLAMFLVVFGHLMNAVNDPAIAVNLVHVPALYFVSGYLCRYSAQKYGEPEFINRKLLTLALPYVIWSFVSLGANTALMAVGGALSMQTALAEAVDIFLYARSVWFLMQLFVAFCAFSLSRWLWRRTGERLKLWQVLLLVYLLLTVILCVVPDEVFALYKFKWLYPFFLAGYFMNDLPEEKSGKPVLTGARVLSLAFPFLGCYAVSEKLFYAYTRLSYSSLAEFGQGLLCYGISALGIILLFWIAEGLERAARCAWMADMGRYSMDIYVIHMFLVKLFPAARVSAFPKPAAVLVALGCAAVITLVIWQLSRRILRRSLLYRLSVGAGAPSGRERADREIHR